MTLSVITRTFDALTPEQQFMLLDYLADRTDVADEIGEGLQAASLAYARSRTDDGDHAEAAAERMVYHGGSPEQFKQWQVYRDLRLSYALRDKSKPFDFRAADKAVSDAELAALSKGQRSFARQIGESA